MNSCFCPSVSFLISAKNKFWYLSNSLRENRSLLANSRSLLTISSNVNGTASFGFLISDVDASSFFTSSFTNNASPSLVSESADVSSIFSSSSFSRGSGLVPSAFSTSALASTFSASALSFFDSSVSALASDGVSSFLASISAIGVSTSFVSVISVFLSVSDSFKVSIGASCLLWSSSLFCTWLLFVTESEVGVTLESFKSFFSKLSFAFIRSFLFLVVKRLTVYKIHVIFIFQLFINCRKMRS